MYPRFLHLHMAPSAADPSGDRSEHRYRPAASIHHETSGYGIRLAEVTWRAGGTHAVCLLAKEMARFCGAELWLQQRSPCGCEPSARQADGYRNGAGGHRVMYAPPREWRLCCV